ncbi:MAG: hypothetical protein V4813_00345 [Gemmatimonadota bacterium]
MSSIHPSPLLRRALIADASGSLVLAVAQLAAAGALAAVLGLPASLLLGTGIFLMVYALLLITVANSSRVARALVLLIVIGNVGWGIGCAELLLSDMVQVTPTGSMFLVAQMIFVLTFSALEYRGLRQSRPAAAPGTPMTAATS